jgi:hypothetical protein
LPSKPITGEQPIKKNVADSSLLATTLNLSNSLAGTLIDCIVVEKDKESRGTTLCRGKRQTSCYSQKKAGKSRKRCTAGLIAAAGQFGLDDDVLAYVRHMKEQEEARVRQQQAKKKDIYDML